MANKGSITREKNRLMAELVDDDEVMPEEDVTATADAVAQDTEQELRDAFHSIENTVNQQCINQKEMVRMLLLAVIAKEHVILVGPWGCNKTRAINSIMRCIDATDKTFYTTLDKSTPPEVLLGMFSPRKMKEEDRWVRNMAGKLPEAHFAFVGEVFRGSSIVRAALHTVMNERYVENDGQRVACPLHTMFCDSNSYPHREEDMPFYDRILLRHHCTYLPGAEKDMFVSMMETEDDLHRIQAVLTYAGVEAATQYAAQAKVPREILEMLHEIRASLLTKGVELSDRRWHRSLNVLKAHAWLRGAAAVDAPDLAALHHVLWHDENQRGPVRDVLAGYTAKTLHNNEADIIANADRIFNEASQQGSEGKWGDALITLAELGEKAVSEKTRAKVQEYITKMEKKIMDGRKNG